MKFTSIFSYIIKPSFAYFFQFVVYSVSSLECFSSPSKKITSYFNLDVFFVGLKGKRYRKGTSSSSDVVNIFIFIVIIIIFFRFPVLTQLHVKNHYSLKRCTSKTKICI